MYNYEYKQKYLNTIDDQILSSKLQSLFEGTATVEEQDGIDICDRDPSTYPSLIIQFSKRKLRFHRAFELFTKLMEYRNYCEIHGFTTPGLADQWFGQHYSIDYIYDIFHSLQQDNEAVDDFAATFDETVLLAKLSTIYPELKNSTLYALPDTITQNEVSAIYMALATYGVELSDISELKKDQFSFAGVELNKAYLSYKDKSITLSPKMSKLIRKTVMSTSVLDGNKKKKKILDGFLFAFEDPEIFHGKIIGKIRKDRSKYDISLPLLKTIYFNSIVRLIAEEENFREINDIEYLAMKYQSITGRNSKFNASQKTEIQGVYDKIVEYYS